MRRTDDRVLQKGTFDVHSTWMDSNHFHSHPSDISITTAFRHVLRVGRIIGKGESMLCKVSTWVAGEIANMVEYILIP